MPQRVHHYGWSDSRWIQGEVQWEAPRDVLFSDVDFGGIEAGLIDQALRIVASDLDGRGFSARLIRKSSRESVTEASVVVDQVLERKGSDEWWFGEIGIDFESSATHVVVKVAPDGDSLNVVAWGKDAEGVSMEVIEEIEELLPK